MGIGSNEQRRQVRPGQARTIDSAEKGPRPPASGSQRVSSARIGWQARGSLTGARCAIACELTIA